jgi:hypothetical protein
MGVLHKYLITLQLNNKFLNNENKTAAAYTTYNAGHYRI